MSKITQQREHFNAVAHRYQSARRHSNHQRLKALLWQYVFEAAGVQLSPNAHVLEPMCGYAEGWSILADHFDIPFNYSGFDYSDVVVEVVQRQQPHLNVYFADATEFHSEALYDLIFLIGGLHHVHDHARSVVRQLASALNPDGYFINFEPTSGNPLFAKTRERIYRRNSLFDAETERAFEVSELMSMFEEAGLIRHFVTFPGLLAYVMYYNPDAFPWLNKGSTTTVDRLFTLEKRWYTTRLARTLSFATLSVWRRPGFD